jgi:hypothetical protein
MARITTAALASDIAALTAQVAALTSALAAQAPASAAPAKPVSQFVTDMRARAAAKVACEIPQHVGKCNRRFSPASAGRENHLARIV